MRKLVGLAAIAMLGVSALSAQQSWRSEIGIQGGYARAKPAGTGAKDYIDFFDVPNFNFSPEFPSYQTVFFVVPWQGKMAFEPSFAVSQLQAGSNALLADLGLRLDYAFTPKIYGAAGVTASIISGGPSSKQLGVAAAVGYHGHLTGPLNGRAEFRANFLKKTNELSPWDIYGVLLGLSTPLGGGAAPTARRGASPSTSEWSRVIGMSGGYSQINAIRGNDDITILAFPLYGSGLAAIGADLPSPATLFAIFPVGRKLALEPGLDFHRLQTEGTTNASANLALRLDYALHGGWYAGVGGNLQYFKTSGVSAVSRTGASVAAGYRFHLVGALGSRVELSHTMWKANDKASNPEAFNTTSILWGVTMPLR